jgi:hypothetical protein
VAEVEEQRGLGPHRAAARGEWERAPRGERKTVTVKLGLGLFPRVN